MSDDYTLDPRRVRRAFERAAARDDQGVFLAREIGDRMLERLELLRRAPDTVLDLGSGTGYCARMLKARYPAAGVVQLDIAYSMVCEARGARSWWRRRIGWHAGRKDLFVCGDMATLPFAARSFDMVWSNLSLHWTNAPQAVFSEIRRVLKPDGVLMFSTLGPDTLKELRACFAATDRFVHVNRFVDLHDLGDMLVKARFADPVMDMEALTLTYEDLRALLRDLKAGGAGNLNSGRNPGLSGKTGLGRVRDAYERYRQSGRLPATFEIVYGQAWRTGTEQRVEDGRSIIRFHPNRRAPPP